jgi:hypothetical protein
MRARDHRRLETHLQRLKEKHQHAAHNIEQTARKLRAAQKHARQQRLLRSGELVELARLDSTDPSTLLGSLCETAERLRDPSAAARWKRLGEPLLTASRQRRSRRRKPSSSDGT